MQNISAFLMSGTARAIGAAIAARTISSVDVTTWYLDRIRRLGRVEGGLNCVRSVSPLALEEARRADAELAEGYYRGPLHGVPYLLKDNVFTVDGSTASAGSMALAAFRPPYEATLVKRLRDAGAVLLGKTNLTEFADFVSDTMPSEFSGAGGVVNHPLGLRYGRGMGSSVGSAAAVGADLCAFAIGTETQNSIQGPAIHTSIVGFKPTVGAVSRHGIVPLVPSQDTPGPLTRTVDDAILVYDAIADTEVGNAATLVRTSDWAPRGRSLAGLRIGIPRKFMADNVMDGVRHTSFERALCALAQAGAVIVDPCDLPSAEQLHEVRSCVFRTEFKESLNGLLETLQPCGMSSLADIIEWNNANSKAIPYGQSLLEASNASPGTGSRDYIADRHRDLAMSIDSGIATAMAVNSVDVLLAPMCAAAKCTGKAGAPVVAIPAGKDRNHHPFGITTFSMPGHDRILLEISAAIEQVIGSRMIRQHI